MTSPFHPEGLVNVFEATFGPSHEGPAHDSRSSTLGIYTITLYGPDSYHDKSKGPRCAVAWGYGAMEERGEDCFTAQEYVAALLWAWNEMTTALEDTHRAMTQRSKGLLAELLQKGGG